MDVLLAERARRGADVYDYEIDGVLRMSPAPRLGHGRWQAAMVNLLTAVLPADAFVIGGPANLGRPGNYVVPDVVVLRATDQPEPDDDVWLARAAIAVEVLSPAKDEAAKVADYRHLIEGGDLALDELWYVDGVRREIRVYDPAVGVLTRTSSVVVLDEVLAPLFG